MSTLVANKLNSFKENEEGVSHMNQLFKPLVINQRIVRRSESDITTTSTLPLSSVNNDSNIPLIYPQFQLGVIPSLKNNRPINSAFIFQQQENNKKILDLKNKPCCSCNKTKCIKKYCECFANNKFCNNCICPNCLNRDIYMTNFYKNDKISNKEIIFCTCSKSGCNKKYCECYKANLKCNIKCRCVNCLNINDIFIKNSNDNNENHNKIISLEETNSESRKKSLNSETNSFSIQRISILIIKNQTLINVDKLNINEIGFLGNKRKKS